MHLTALIRLKLQQELQTHSVHILELAVEVTELSSEAFLERPKFRRDFASFLKEYIKFTRITPFLQFVVCRQQFLMGILSEFRPVKHHAHLTGLEFFIILFLLMLGTHRTIQILPLGELEIDTPWTEYPVQMIKQRIELKTFHLQFFRRR